MKPVKVFVYGTLKEGFGNHKHLLGSHIVAGTVRKVGEYSTKEKFGLTNTGFPYMIDRDFPVKYEVLGEVYEIDDPKVVARLDALEGIDYGHYAKKIIGVQSLDGHDEDEVFAYVAETQHAESHQLCETVTMGDKTLFEWK